MKKLQAELVHVFFQDLKYKVNMIKKILNSYFLAHQAKTHRGNFQTLLHKLRSFDRNPHFRFFDFEKPKIKVFQLYLRCIHKQKKV